MIITVEKKTTKQIEVDAPSYYEYGFCLFKIMNEKEYIEVENGEDFGIRIQNGSNIIAIVADDGKKVSAEIFESAYAKVLKKLSTIR